MSGINTIRGCISLDKGWKKWKTEEAFCLLCCWAQTELALSSPTSRISDHFKKLHKHWCSLTAWTLTLTTIDKVKIIVTAIKCFSSRLAISWGLDGHFVFFTFPHPLPGEVLLLSSPGLNGIFTGKTFWTPVPTSGWNSSSSYFIWSLDFLSHSHPTAMNYFYCDCLVDWKSLPRSDTPQPEYCIVSCCSPSAKHDVHRSMFVDGQMDE